MMAAYRACRKCTFWVTVQDEYCPNCGIVAPHPFRRPSDHYILLGLTSLLIHFAFVILEHVTNSGLLINVGILAVVIVDLMLATITTNNITNFLKKKILFFKSLGAWSLCFCLVCLLTGLSWTIAGFLNTSFRFTLPIQWFHQLTGILLSDIGLVIFGSIHGILIGSVNKLFTALRRYSYRKGLHGGRSFSLQQLEQAIRERIGEIRTNIKSIRNLQQQIAQESPKMRSQKVLQRLKNGFSILLVQQDLYRTKLWELELVRWHHNLKPLLDDMEHLSKKKCEQHIKRLTLIQEQGKALLQTWEESDLVSNVNGAKCIQRLRQALETCAIIREDLRAKQATFALKGIRILGKTRGLASGVVEEIDYFNILPDVEMFSQGFRQLEEEYIRLQSEEEVRREFNI